MLALRFDTKRLEQQVAALQATDDQVRRALNTTIGRINTAIRRAGLRAMSDETGLPQKRFAKRIRSFRLLKSAHQGWKIFVGLDSLNLLELGAKETQTGVKAKGVEHKSAFIAVMPNGKAGVFKRRGKERLKIAAVRHDIEHIGDDILAEAEQIFDARFWKTFEHQLKWQTQTPK